MKNLHLLFNKTYYSRLGCELEELTRFMDDCNRQLFAATFEEEDYIPAPVPNISAFLMQVSYPGLLIGVGNSHGTGIVQEDINSGFMLEYVSGQPYIPSYAVKGMLRSCFSHPEVIEELLPCVAGCVPALERDIFEDSDTATDIFFDAVVRRGNREKHLLTRDFISSHVQGVTQNPVPVQIIKLVPEVVLEFRFVLTDSVLQGADGSIITVTPRDKLALFAGLMEIFGVGAKTNTGYGVLKPVSQADLAFAPVCAELVPGEIYDATVAGMNDNFAFIQLDCRDKTDRVHHSKVANAFVPQGAIHKFLSVGQRVRVKYIQSVINGRETCQFSIRDAVEQKEEASV